jgi:hypothetical protein
MSQEAPQEISALQTQTTLDEWPVGYIASRVWDGEHSGQPVNIRAACPTRD